MKSPVIQTGLEHFLEHPPDWAKKARLGLLCNPASVNTKFQHARNLINQKFPGQLTALFSPQHGFFAEKQDNMIESDHITDPLLNIPVFSLYGETRIPTKKMFDSIDILLVDLQDAGTRVYTFVYTVSYCMETAKSLNKKIVILDRPNPINGIQIEGNCLKREWASFVGRYPIPMRHGLTLGELACLFNDYFQIDCDLEVVAMKFWDRHMYYQDTGLAWVPPSPNLPTPVSAMVYPGQVIWEGTNISEGRGTTQPFEIFGAPFLDTNKILSTIQGPVLPGCVLRPLIFEPTANKWAGQSCKGFQIHITNPYEFQAFQTSLKLLRAMRLHHADLLEWKKPPYEYEYQRLPMDLILGDKNLRVKLEQLISINELEKTWIDELNRFKEISERYHIYKLKYPGAKRPDLG